MIGLKENRVNLLKNVELTGVVTAFYSQYCMEKSIIEMTQDVKREGIVNYFKNAFENVGRNPHNLMTIEKIDLSSIINVAYRNKLFDQVLTEHLKKEPCRDVISIGAGFDTRYFRLNNFKGSFYDVDFKNVTNLKKDMVQENTQYHLIATKSAITEKFLKQELSLTKDNPIFIAEGVMCYIKYPALCKFIEKLFECFPKATLICDVFLFEKHLVFDDVESKTLLKHPECDGKKIEKYKKIYSICDALKKVFCFENKSYPNLSEIVELKKILCDSQKDAFNYNNQTFKPNYWIGVYEKIGLKENMCDNGC